MPEQLGRVYLGLTDEDAPGPIPDVPEPSSAEVAFLLDTVNTALGTRSAPADVIGAYAGLRPLIDTGEGRTSDVSRDHAVFESPSGVISVVGGKLTEYRYMAEDVLNRAISLRQLRAGECRTRNLPLIGAPANPGPACRGPAPVLPRVVGAAVWGRGAQRHRRRYLRAADRAGRRGHRRDPGGVRIRGDP